MAVLLETSKGDIVIDLYVEARHRCCLNFLKLCKIKYYNFCLFHDVQRNYTVQSGDPTGTGGGGESVWGVVKGPEYRYFASETVPRLKHDKVGLVSMVDSGNGLHGSQFLITTGDSLDYLDGKHTVFGEVAEGADVLTEINEAFCDDKGQPFQDIRIYHTVILDDPFDDPSGLVVPERSPSPPKEVTDSLRIGAEEEIDDFKGKTEEEVKEIVQTRESKANAQILEMVGDIPDADARPPENVLFVCKLNPVTTGEDLEIIFSRFGPIVSSEVIRDQKTGDSLQYAFIDFENEEDTIKAYFKMDNVLIDDRRIHVDFSQSLAKVKGLHRRKLSSETHSRQDDGLVVPRTKKQKDDGYEMVFESNPTPAREVEKDRGGRSERPNHRRREGGGGGDEERKRRRESPSGSHRHSRERRRDRSRSRSKERRRGRSRSRSRSRERRRAYKEPGRRDRSRSRERRHRHRK